MVFWTTVLARSPRNNNLPDARKQVAGYVEFYNTKKLHISLFYFKPKDYLKGNITESL